jgi:hypothetical protein
LRIDSDGRIAWRGFENVSTIGERTRTVPPRLTAPLFATIARIRFFDRDAMGELPPEMICETRGNSKTCGFTTSTVICSDTSHSIITVVREHETHRVNHAHCVESPLDDLERQIDEIAGTAEWIGPSD